MFEQNIDGLKRSLSTKSRRMSRITEIALVTNYFRTNPNNNNYYYISVITTTIITIIIIQIIIINNQKRIQISHLLHLHCVLRSDSLRSSLIRCVIRSLLYYSNTMFFCMCLYPISPIIVLVLVSISSYATSKNKKKNTHYFIYYFFLRHNICILLV